MQETRDIISGKIQTKSYASMAEIYAEIAAERLFHAPTMPQPQAAPLKKQTSNDSVPYRESSFYKELKEELTPAVNLKAMRECKGMTLAQLSKKSGISAANLSAMEAGRRGIGKKSAEKLAKAIGLGTPKSYSW
jgi:ribosome-binding protein aMBF1 (putative translation factor)